MRKRLTFRLDADPNSPYRIVVHRYAVHIGDFSWHVDAVSSDPVFLEIARSAGARVHTDLEYPRAMKKAAPGGSGPLIVLKPA